MRNDYIYWEIIELLFNKIWSYYYYNISLSPFADISYGYAITSYKSQGSTYSDVFIGIPNMLNCSMVDPYVRMKSLYTAITRASNSIYIYNINGYIFPLVKEIKYKCIICTKVQDYNEFYKINYKIDIKCTEELLSKIKKYEIYNSNANLNIKYIADKNKYLHLYNDNINIEDINIEDINIEDEMETYQYNNLINIQHATH
jgi:hypothetical protein